jgi:hypothetical protein
MPDFKLWLSEKKSLNPLKTSWSQITKACRGLTPLYKNSRMLSLMDRMPTQSVLHLQDADVEHAVAEAVPAAARLQQAQAKPVQQLLAVVEEVPLSQQKKRHPRKVVVKANQKRI